MEPTTTTSCSSCCLAGCAAPLIIVILLVIMLVQLAGCNENQPSSSQPQEASQDANN